MGITEKQNCIVGFKASICIMDYTFAGGEANFVEIFPTVDAGSVAVAVYLENIEAFEL